jgi:L-xylulokinase
VADRYLLGLDVGNTVIKAVLFDLGGRQVGFHALKGPSSPPSGPGHVERDMHALWANVRAVIAGCIGAAGVAPRQIAAVGCAGHGNGLYLLDRTGAPLIGILSLDSRAAALAAELDAGIGAQVHPLALQRPWPAQTPVLMRWLRRHRPELWERAGTAFLCKDYICWRLTGARVSDLSDMSGCGLLRVPDGTYDDGLLTHWGLRDDRHLLPPLVAPADIAGRVTAEAAAETGLAAGTPVIGGFFDVISSAIGSGVVRPGEASIIAGSWSINQVFSAAPVIDERLFMVSTFGPGRFVSIESSATSAANLEWYVRELIERGARQGDPFAYVAASMEGIRPGADDPLFLPFLYGARDGAHARAGFHGIAGWHREGHLLRALHEGVVFEHRRHIDRLRGAGLAVERAVLAGGGARSALWPQMFADVLGIPISTAAGRETGALGAAIGAGIGIGLLTDFEEGIARMTPALRSHLPDAAMASHYARRFEAYGALIEALSGFWRGLDAGRQQAQTAQ